MSKPLKEVRPPGGTHEIDVDAADAFDFWWNDQDNGCPTLVLDNDEDFAKAAWGAAIHFATNPTLHHK